MPAVKTSPEEIIRTSIHVFRRNGYYRTSMSDLAKATGLTKGAFYHHFTNKEEVMKMSLMATSKWFEKNIFSIAYDPNVPHKKRLVLMGERLLDAFSLNSGGCFFANTILETSHVEDTFLEELNAFFERFEHALEQIFKSKYQGKTLKNMIQQVIAEIEGSLILMQLKKDTNLLRNTLNRIQTHY